RCTGEGDGGAEEARSAEPKVGEHVEDEFNAANNIRRKLWRMERALEWVKPDRVGMEKVGAVLWWMSQGNRDAGRQVFVDWAGAGAEARWTKGFDGKWGSPEEIWRIAQRAGWRYPLAVNLNKLDEMAERVEAALMRVDAEIYQLGKRLV